jgi:heparosan-N-sulfate-glucuronate 5-epimerase
MRDVTRWLRHSWRWARVAMGTSYYHQLQPLGQAFLPGELAGYCNDMTAKTKWIGETDAEGMPLIVLPSGRSVRFATTIVQKALGHWDLWLSTHDGAQKDEFLRLCRCLLAAQDERGGWSIWPELGSQSESPYSAMTQGECISAFVRAARLTNDAAFAGAALRAFDLMARPVAEGGPLMREGDDVYLEEEPVTPRSSILNGWMFALLGLHDLCLACGKEEAHQLFRDSLRTLKKRLCEYDAGYWSYYDLRGHLASRFYHELHVALLSALVLVEGDRVLIQHCERWARNAGDPGSRMKAFLVKAGQKLREPSEAVAVR